jgi:hypothetical protein
MELDVASYRRVAERWSTKEEDINPSAAAVLMLQMCSEIERLRGGWIPVSERLPEEEQEVLVWNGGGQCLKPWQGHVLCEYRNGEWRESQESDLYPGITHWMPLPEPPEVK